MQNAWFRLKFFLLILVTLGVALFSVPQNIVQYFPVSVQELVQNNEMKLGIDLAGGAKLDYKIDFADAEQKARLASSSDIEFSENFNKSEIAKGVVATLKKRVDPDGTKEVSVFASQRGDEWYVVVELTADIDTPENRAKLEKVTSLAFKKPFVTDSEKKAVADTIFKQTLLENKDFDEVAKPLVLAKEGYGLNLENAFLDELTQAFQSEEIAAEVLTRNPQATGWNDKIIDMGSGIYAMTYFESVLGKTERTFVSSEKSFEDAKTAYPQLLLENQTIADIKLLSENAVSVVAELEVLETTSIDSLLIEKTLYNQEKGQYEYSLINFSGAENVSDEERVKYEAKETTQSVDSRSVRILYIQPQWQETPLGGGQFKVAKVGTDPNTGHPVTSIEFTQAGALLFSEITGELAERTNPLCSGEGDVFAIFVDGAEISSPCVRERIEGDAQISFGGTNIQAVQKEANSLVENLNSGATPAPVSLESEQKISATLGEKALALSITAAMIGFALVAVWMLFFFRWFGFLAILALIFYALVLLFLFKSLGFVLTLAGVAGVILSIGMAVDANVLIFERIKEEIAEGEKFSDAVETGFDRAWTSIRDSNISSLITCFILYALGTSVIMAFAITLAIGILVSMFTAITFTRYLILGLTPKSIQKNPAILLGGKKI